MPRRTRRAAISVVRLCLASTLIHVYYHWPLYGPLLLTQLSPHTLSPVAPLLTLYLLLCLSLSLSPFLRFSPLCLPLALSCVAIVCADRNVSNYKFARAHPLRPPPHFLAAQIRIHIF